MMMCKTAFIQMTAVGERLHYQLSSTPTKTKVAGFLKGNREGMKGGYGEAKKWGTKKIIGRTWGYGKLQESKWKITKNDWTMWVGTRYIL